MSLSVIENCIRTLAKSWHIPSLADIERVEAVPPCWEPRRRACYPRPTDQYDHTLNDMIEKAY